MRLLSDFDKEAWRRFVLCHEKGNIFQLPEMVSVYEADKRYGVIKLFAVEEDIIFGVLIAFIIKEPGFIISKASARAIIQGGPLTSGADKVSELLIKEFVRVSEKRAIYSQIRNIYDMSDLHDMLFKYRFEFEEHLNYIIDLTLSIDDLWSGLYSKRRNEIRKAEKLGTVVKEITSIDEFKNAVEILKEVYSRAGLPMPPMSFFCSAWTEMYNRDHLVVFGAYNNNKLIGTIFLLTYNNTLYDWYAGSYKDYYSMHPNDILPWEAFKWAREKGFERFDFGGAGHPLKPYGVRDYKKKFGGKQINHGRYIRVNKRILYGTIKFAFRILQAAHLGIKKLLS